MTPDVQEALRGNVAMTLSVLDYEELNTSQTQHSGHTCRVGLLVAQMVKKPPAV